MEQCCQQIRLTNETDWLLQVTCCMRAHASRDTISGIKWDQVGSSGINFDPDSEIVRFGAIFEYCCDIVRILFLGAILAIFGKSCDLLR